jgi:hypothetical protein
LPSPSALPPLSAGTAPASFQGGTKENIANAVGLGCEATSVDGWLQFLCRKKNGTGGHPVRATVHGNAPSDPARPDGTENAPADAGAGDEIAANDQGELNIVLPWSAAEQRTVEIEWSDTSYTLHVNGAKATLDWAAGGIALRRACQKVLEEGKAVLSAAQKTEGEARLTTTETAKLSRFGVCQQGGLGSWAIALKAAAGKGEGATRAEHLELEVVRIDQSGARLSASFGSFDVAPGGFELAALQVYDYDDDGRDELIAPYEVKATAGAQPASASPIWSFSDTALTPYAKAPSVGGGIAVEQLDFDMRPDLSTYGAFVAFLGADCGLKVCPPRVTGPKFFWHATPSGAFTASDQAARAALKRASCQSKPANVVVESGGSLNVALTAKNLVCAKAWGVSEAVVVSELTAKHAALCGDAASCPLQNTFEAWLKLPLPSELTAKN